MYIIVSTEMLAAEVNGDIGNIAAAMEELAKVGLLEMKEGARTSSVSSKRKVYLKRFV